VILGVDCGRSYVKNVTKGLQKGELYRDSFESIIGSGRQLKINKRAAHEIECWFEDKHYFIGELAADESKDARQLMLTKNHKDTLILTLVAAARAGAHGKISVVTGLPVENHTPEQKQAIAQLLQGEGQTYRIDVNGTKYSIKIDRVAVAVEGGAAYWAEDKPAEGLVRVLDIGSKTVNYVTIKNKRFRDNGSGTLNKGVETMGGSSESEHVEAIAGALGREGWEEGDEVIVVGGKALDLLPHVQEFFPNARLPRTDWRIFPHLKTKTDNERAAEIAKFANAIGAYRMGAAMLQ
jgi:plasmid segregation protein ParM